MMVTTPIEPSICDEQLAELTAIISASSASYPQSSLWRSVLARLRAAEAKRDELRADNLDIVASNIKLSAQVKALHLVGHALSLLPGADVTLDVLPAVKALQKDAERWRHARNILTVEAIETAQSDYLNFGLPPAESESVRADQAIDAAMAAKEGV